VTEDQPMQVCIPARLRLSALPRAGTVAARLGHASVSMTLSTYARVTPSIEADGVAKIAAALG
jgi:integrase